MKPFRIGIWTVQSLPWETQVEQWRLLEALGFDTIGLVDHFMPTRGDEDVPFLEGWTLLAALGALTPRVRVAVLVSGNTYRNPVLLAKEAVTVDHITGGRLDLGIGAGWVEREHEAYGFDFPSPGKRVDMLAEAVQIIRSLMRGGRSTFEGTYYRLNNAAFQPPPIQQGGIPLIIAGHGERMLRLAAEHADTWNINDSPAVMAERGVRLIDHCQAIGRDPDAMRWGAFCAPAFVKQDPFEHVDAFRELCLAYIAAGADEIQIRMPEGAGLAVLEDTPAVFDDLRDAHARRASRPT